mgnify:CR=1 FL=1
MNIFFRVDSSNIIGTGHIIRCIKLAKYLKNHNIFFICKKFEGNLNSKVSENNFKLFELDIENDNSVLLDTNTWLGEDYEEDAIKTNNILKMYVVNLLIIDNYAIDFKWQNLVKDFSKKILVIDDYIKRKHNCDFILNSIEEDQNKYKFLCNEDCKLLLGPEYFIIDKEFFYLSKKKRFNESIKRIFVFISGSDINNYTYKIMKYLENKFNYIIFDILIGMSNKNKDSIEELCNKNNNFNFYYNINNVYDIMFNADLCIGTLGQNFIERMIFGIPSIVFTIAENQFGFLNKYKDKEIFLYNGHLINDFEKIYQDINKLINDRLLFKNLIENNINTSKLFKSFTIKNIING